MITVSYKCSCHCQTSTFFSMQLTTFVSEIKSVISESESLSSSDVLSSTIQGEEISSHPMSHLPQRSLPLSTPICTEHCNIQNKGMFKSRYELSIMFILLPCTAVMIHSLMALTSY